MQSEMNESIRIMVAEINSILAQKLQSVWLYGSVVLNDFRLGWSDIDFIALTSEPITQEQAKLLLNLRQSLSARYPKNPYYRCFEGVILNFDEFNKASYTLGIYWGTSGQRITDNLEMDVFARYELAKYGKLVYGDASREMFTLPDRKELIVAVKRHYEAIRSYVTETDESLYSCGWLLDIARCIYTLRYNDVTGKTQAGLWALENRIFMDDEPLRRTIEIRQSPLEYKDRAEVKRWLSELGTTVQEYADVLHNEIKKCHKVFVAENQLM